MTTPDNDKNAYIARIHGRVQGVGFRYTARREAVRLKLRGWVRNEADGSVTAEFEGDADACTAFLRWLRRGPPGAVVSSIDSREMQYRGIYRRFSVEF